MGRLIDETDLKNLLYVLDDARYDLYYAIKKIPELPTVEAIPKDQYEARLKADMVAMLEEIKNQTDDYMERKWETLTDAHKAGCPTIDDWKYHIAEVVDDYIQQKINSLKE